jgi:chloramphenicol O-acetyltransferase type B
MMRRILGFQASIFSFCSGYCEFGEYSTVFPRCILNDFKLGRFSYVNSGSQGHLCSVGAFCSIGRNVQLGGLGIHPKHLSTHPAFFDKAPPGGVSFNVVDGHINFSETRIDHDVWIGDRAIIMGGVRVQTGAIVGAGAVVTKDIGAYEIVAGVPARLIGRRYDRGEADRLLEIAWWEWPIEKLKEAGSVIGSPHLDELLAYADAR